MGMGKMKNNIKYQYMIHNDTRNGNHLLQISFSDKTGKEYIWTPKWDDMSSILEASVQVERMNGGRNWVGIAKSSMWVLSFLINLLHVPNDSCLPSDIIGPDRYPVDMVQVSTEKMVI
jgi:hypothetical protein